MIARFGCFSRILSVSGMPKRSASPTSGAEGACGTASSVEPNLVLQRDEASVDAFKAQFVIAFSPTTSTSISSIGIARPLKEPNCALVQATVYREGRPDDFLEFVNGALDRRPRRPVFEAAITYEPATGVIEVVANDRESREDLRSSVRA